MTISGRLAWVGMNIDIGDSWTSGLISDLRAWIARASFDKKISAGGVLLCGMGTEGKNGMVLSWLCDCKGWLGA